jgi:hypothetical protein
MNDSSKDDADARRKFWNGLRAFDGSSIASANSLSSAARSSARVVQMKFLLSRPKKPTMSRLDTVNAHLRCVGVARSGCCAWRHRWWGGLEIFQTEAISYAGRWLVLSGIREFFERIRSTIEVKEFEVARMMAADGDTLPSDSTPIMSTA